MTNQMLSLQEVTQYLELEKKDVEELVKKDKLNAYKIGGVYLRFKHEQVIALKNAVRKTARPTNTAIEHLRNFWEYNNFYIITSVCLVVILYFALR